MKIEKGKATGVQIAYIGGGSRGWAWALMSDLVSCSDMSGTIRLYDIDKNAAECNKIVGEKFNSAKGAVSTWEYEVSETLSDALKGANFVVISIMPGTFDEMESDVHEPEKYGIYQSVGDTVGAGGIVRSLRTAPMMEEIAFAVRDNCPKAWVINYTNPMTLCVKTLYRAFPEIKAFGCCHEVFGTQKLLATALDDILGIKGVTREEIKVNPIGINHFTWLTSAKYQDIDLYEVYTKFVEKYYESGYKEEKEENWADKFWKRAERVKMDLFKRYGVIAAAGDRHLAEFCPGNWYLKDRDTVEEWMFAITDVSYRKQDLKDRLKKSADLVSGEQSPEIQPTGEDGVNQMRALLGLHEMITNVNIPNVGQIPNLPLGAVVETNAIFRADEVQPVFAGPIPKQLYAMIAHIVGEQEALDEAIAEKSLEKAFNVFAGSPQVPCSLSDARTLFYTMIENTKEYLKGYK